MGGHRDLLAYLVRRLLENGANTSFVSVAADPQVPIETVLRQPWDAIADASQVRHRKIPLPRDVYAPARVNSAGIEFGHRESLEALVRAVAEAGRGMARERPPVGDKPAAGEARLVVSPIDGVALGTVVEVDAATADRAMAAAAKGFAAWNAQPVDRRAAALEATAALYERHGPALLALLQSEGGKTLDDAVAELREAIDFCRYYAVEARRSLAPLPLPGPTGESNELRYRGRGVFVCISPWNFPLAIFTGQVAAALAAGNCVVAKPAEQTPLIAELAVRLMRQAGIDADALHLVFGDGRAGAALVDDARTAGVAFTGSTGVGRLIHRALAAKDGPLVPLIAETGGINAMIVDATALPEQVVDDVIVSAFRSAGQRCSALRLLCLQAETADRLIGMIAGAARELAIGDPRDPSVHIGPVIDAGAQKRLLDWIGEWRQRGRLRFRWDDGRTLPAAGYYVPPAIVELDRAGDLREEVFGPVLHVVRWHSGELDRLLDDIAGNGTALTLGIHTRIDSRVAQIARRMRSGNIYVNRSMIGATVGTQPFGGTGTSGTGPKAGGPNYLRAFATEQTFTVNTAAAGGNASLLAVDE